MLYEVITDAMDILRRKRDRRLIRLLASPPGGSSVQVKSVRNGYLCQIADTQQENPADWKVVTRRQPTEDEQAALIFAWRVVSYNFV